MSTRPPPLELSEFNQQLGKKCTEAMMHPFSEKASFDQLQTPNDTYNPSTIEGTQAMVDGARKLLAKLQEKRVAVLAKSAEFHEEAEIRWRTARADLEKKKKRSDDGFGLDPLLKLAFMATVFEKFGVENDKSDVAETLLELRSTADKLAVACTTIEKGKPKNLQILEKGISNISICGDWNKISGSINMQKWAFGEHLASQEAFESFIANTGRDSLKAEYEKAKDRARKFWQTSINRSYKITPQKTTAPLLEAEGKEHDLGKKFDPATLSREAIGQFSMPIMERFATRPSSSATSSGAPPRIDLLNGGKKILKRSAEGDNDLGSEEGGKKKREAHWRGWTWLY
ncbi:hypothetical protein BOTCAL_0917g00010 [Botryotinia calthae]|uniref:Uncharacterized protein n=1 Tax=Botryotinia calthae TaxID=38488 RepID=A0A4Y8CF08_9HELO|nr:hypothetical protein BOTCAL_0917g00010 [Botryotinia calthae]